jgi:hypothetical protein
VNGRQHFSEDVEASSLCVCRVDIGQRRRGGGGRGGGGRGGVSRGLLQSDGVAVVEQDDESLHGQLHQRLGCVCSDE